MKLPYVYRLVDLKTGKWYIGSRTAKNCCCAELGVKYFTSSKYVEPLFKASPLRFLIEIMHEDQDADYVVEVESNLLKYYDARKDPMSYNCTNGDKKFNAKKCSLLMWENENHRIRISEVHKELCKTDWRKEQLARASLGCRTPESLLKLSETHKELAKTESRIKQLQKAREASHTDEARRKRSDSMKAISADGGLAKFQEVGSKSHFEKLKLDPDYAKRYSDQLKAGWVKRKANKGII